jgi:hypothetical protein
MNKIFTDQIKLVLSRIIDYNQKLLH